MNADHSKRVDVPIGLESTKLSDFATPPSPTERDPMKKLQIVKSWLIAQLLLEAGEKQIAASVNQIRDAYLFELSSEGMELFEAMVSGNFPITHFKRPLEGGDNFRDLILEVVILPDEISLGLTGVYAWGPRAGERVKLPIPPRKWDTWDRVLFWARQPWARGEPWVCNQYRYPLPTLIPRPIGGLCSIPYGGMLYLPGSKVFVTKTWED